MLSLRTVQSDVQRVAEAIAVALGVDVEITDRDLIRVAGTGEFSRQLGNSLAGQGRVHAHVLQIGATIIIEDPGHHELCRTCVMAKRCYATAELCCPINHQGGIVGVMGLVSHTQAQRRRLLDNVRANVAFLERMADLLSAKITSEEATARDRFRRRQLEAVIGAFDQGVLVVDEYGTMTQANRYALDALHLSPEAIAGKRLQDVLAGTGLYDALGRGTEIRHHRARLKQHSGDTVDAICNAYPVAVDGKTLGAVLTFQRLDDVSRFTYEIWEHENRATSFDDIIGDSQPMSSVKEFAAKIASGDSTVLLRGESGTGKGLMARAIHRASRRKDGPFVVVNCSAIPDTLLESELFGYEEGAFTGARKKGKLGRFELANNGTLFLDEIGDMPLHLQGKLLRALEDRMIEPVGGVESRPIDVRIIGATNRDLDTMVASREFRKDLFYRLNVVPILMPPLRERRDDIPMLTRFFLDKHCRTVGKNMSAFSDGALQCMLAYEWPGNVRELSNSVEYAVNIESESTVQITSLPQRVRTVGRPVGFDEADSPQALEALERQAIAEALRRFEGELRAKEKAARELGIHVTTLYRKIAKYNLA